MLPCLFGYTINAYDNSIEPNVRTLNESIKCFNRMAAIVGSNRIHWRYDPIFYIAGHYETSMKMHIKAFEYIAKNLERNTDKVVISFIDDCNKVKQNFNESCSYIKEQKYELVEWLAKIARRVGITLYVCHEELGLNITGVIENDCNSIKEINDRLNLSLKTPRGFKPGRTGCSCIINGDIGQYNTCIAGCKYCYATNDSAYARRLSAEHHKDSSCLIGYVGDSKVLNAKQISWK